jgi:hypothetical protein
MQFLRGCCILKPDPPTHHRHPKTHLKKALRQPFVRLQIFHRPSAASGLWCVPISTDLPCFSRMLVIQLNTSTPTFLTLHGVERLLVET